MEANCSSSALLGRGAASITAVIGIVTTCSTDSGFPIRLATERFDAPARGGRIPDSTGASGLEIRVLGAFAVLRDGAPVPLPPSRKTRALLAYLAIDGRKHQRERLCELFWELPDDPRGALRWSLSRIRQVLGDDANVLKADRNTVQLCLENAGFGYASMRGLTQLDLNACPLTVLESCAAQFCRAVPRGPVACPAVRNSRPGARRSPTRRMCCTSGCCAR